MKVVGWTEWDDHYFEENDPELYKKQIKATIKGLRKYKIHFGASYHQNGEYGVPVFDDGSRMQTSQRSWGEIMAEAYSEEFDDPKDDRNYVVWYLSPPELKWKLPPKRMRIDAME